MTKQTQHIGHIKSKLLSGEVRIPTTFVAKFAAQADLSARAGVSEAKKLAGELG